VPGSTPLDAVCIGGRRNVWQVLRQGSAESLVNAAKQGVCPVGVTSDLRRQNVGPHRTVGGVKGARGECVNVMLKIRLSARMPPLQRIGDELVFGHGAAMAYLLYSYKFRDVVPLLDEAEWAEVRPLLTGNAVRVTDQIIYRNVPRDDALQRFPEVGDLVRRYDSINGTSLIAPIALWHVRMADYGALCAGCGKPYRTPRAKMCPECGKTAWCRIRLLTLSLQEPVVGL